MTKDEISTKNETSIFIQKNSVAIRIWHWLTFLTIISLFVTVLMASTALNPRKNIAEVQNALKEKGVIVSNEQAWAVSHMYDDKMWDFHKILGFALTFLFLSRIVIEGTQPKKEKVNFRIKNALAAFRQPGQDKKELKHYLLVKGSYFALYLLLLAMVGTGLVIAFGSDLGISGPVRHSVKEAHGVFQYGFYTFVAAHLIGVVVADLGKAKGVVSGMINGGK